MAAVESSRRDRSPGHATAAQRGRCEEIERVIDATFFDSVETSVHVGAGSSGMPVLPPSTSLLAGDLLSQFQNCFRIVNRQARWTKPSNNSA